MYSSYTSNISRVKGNAYFKKIGVLLYVFLGDHFVVRLIRLLPGLGGLHNHQVLHHVNLRLQLLCLHLHELLYLLQHFSVLLCQLQDILYV